MAKFLILFESDMSADDLMASATPEEMQASMKEWMVWADEANKTVKFEFGLPLRAVNKVTTNGVEAADSRISGHAFMEADSKEAITSLLTSHPHLKRGGSSIDVLELLSMPGM